FLGYCSGRSRLEGQVAGLTVTPLPDNLRVGPEYGVALLAGARPRATDLVLYILSPAGQATLARHGFTPVGLPAPGRGPRPRGAPDDETMRRAPTPRIRSEGEIAPARRRQRLR